MSDQPIERLTADAAAQEIEQWAIHETEAGRLCCGACGGLSPVAGTCQDCGAVHEIHGIAEAYTCGDCGGFVDEEGLRPGDVEHKGDCRVYSILRALLQSGQVGERIRMQALRDCAGWLRCRAQYRRTLAAPTQEITVRGPDGGVDFFGQGVVEFDGVTVHSEVASEIEVEADALDNLVGGIANMHRCQKHALGLIDVHWTPEKFGEDCPFCDALESERQADKYLADARQAFERKATALEDRLAELQADHYALQAQAAALRSALGDMVDRYGVDLHNRVGCPEDDTCECEPVAILEAALATDAGVILLRDLDNERDRSRRHKRRADSFQRDWMEAKHEYFRERKADRAAMTKVAAIIREQWGECEALAALEGRLGR